MALSIATFVRWGLTRALFLCFLLWLWSTVWRLFFPISRTTYCRQVIAYRDRFSSPATQRLFQRAYMSVFGILYLLHLLEDVNNTSEQEEE